MKFLYQRFNARRGQKVQVEFSTPTKVKLLSSSDFDRYRKCRTNSYYGGQYEKSPAIFEVPNDGEWVAVIEKGTHYNPMEVEGKVTLLGDDANVKTTKALDAPAEEQPKAEVVEIVEEHNDSTEEFQSETSEEDEEN